jgi:hypothetical protein
MHRVPAQGNQFYPLRQRAFFQALDNISQAQENHLVPMRTYAGQKPKIMGRIGTAEIRY